MAVRFIVGIPAYRRMVDVDQFACGLELGRELAHRPGLEYVGFLQPDSCYIDWSRDDIVYRALQTQVPWVIMVDADTLALRADKLLNMLETGIQTGAAMIGAPVLMRHGRAYNVKIGPKGWAEPSAFFNQVREVDAIGTGCVAVNCNWLREHMPFSPWFQPIRPRMKYDQPPMKVGQDLMFCLKVRQAGGKILCDGRWEPRHVGVMATGHQVIDEHNDGQPLAQVG